MKPAPSHSRAGQDRWLVSYADLVTLLLALFAALYAASTIDARKLGSLSSSLQKAFDTPPATAEETGEAIVPPVGVLPERRATDDLQARLARELADALRNEHIQMHRDARGLIVTLPEEAAFPTASADVSDEARQLIGRVASVLTTTSNGVRIEGHTDDVPIRTSRFISNWELSTARASAVVEFLVKTAGLSPERLSAAGYGEFHPKAPNDTPENRARNRRIDIVILETPSTGASR